MTSERFVLRSGHVKGAGMYMGLRGNPVHMRNGAYVYSDRCTTVPNWRWVRLRPKAPVRDEAAIRKAERERIAGLLHGDCTGAYLGETRLSSNSTYRLTVEALRIAIVSKDWPVAR